jgi:hypothetical protein
MYYSYKQLDTHSLLNPKLLAMSMSFIMFNKIDNLLVTLVLS